MTEANKCDFNADQMYLDIKKFLENKDLESALSYVDSKQHCADSDFKKAVILTYVGEIHRAGYGLTEKYELAEWAEELYLKALELNTDHNSKIYLHLALLMKDKDDYALASKYMEKALSFQPELGEAMPYLGAALQIAVGNSDWERARKLTGVLYNIKNSYFFNTRLLLPSIQTFCATGEINTAEAFIDLIVKHDVVLSSIERGYFERSKRILEECKKKII